ncbi:MAG: hypothetical protein CMC05_12395 [Flavobacteriaceae bacterium]|nr:hypothetical protein [Flavobacteriaceae bacterium]
MFRYLFFILYVFSFPFKGFAQEPLYVDGSEVGNGIGFNRLGESFVITPAHVVDGTTKSILITDEMKSISKAKLVESYSNDIAILRVQNKDNSYLPLKLDEKFESGISNASAGFVAYIDPLGIINYIHVSITSKDASSFTITPKIESQTFKKGMSGSPFYIMYDDTKVLAGLLMSIEENLSEALVFQFDDIIASVSSFTTIKSVRKQRVGIFWNTNNDECLAILNQVTTAIKGLDDYLIIDRVPARKYLDSNYELIRNGSQISNIPKKLSDKLDLVLFGNIEITQTTNSKKMPIVNLDFEGALYKSQDFSLEDSISISSKGLGYNLDSAKKQAIKELIKKIKRQLHEK